MSDLHACQECGKQFVDRKHPNRKYCSTACSSKSQQRRVTKHCPTCDNDFQVRPNRKDRIYCSRKCYLEREITGPNLEQRTCSHCGKAFETWPSRSTEYCSKDCSNKAKEVPGSIITKVCRTCGKYYTVKRSQMLLRGSNYCSRDCMGAATSKRMRGPKNHNYRGGAIPYRGRNWRRQSRKARERDGYRCQICHKKPKSRHCHVHHIKPYREFNNDWQSANNLSNLITLCSSCHRKVEDRKIPCPKLLLP